ncbi:hypothetical protein [Aquabacterium sp.]|uniref:hypothetical protein n=1 Tax=Aquabacterium sp. TaxID=1872578 RepID=UPI0035C765FC
MKPVAFQFRLVAISALGMGAMSAAHADLTIPFGWTDSNSVQAFPAENLGAFDLVKLTVSAKGNTTPVGTPVPGESNGTLTPPAFKFPITKIVIGSKLNIVSGSAVGSALYFERLNDDTGATLGFTLANFTINYDKKQVLADVTPNGGAVALQQPIYNFNVATPLALKFKLPLTVTGHEVLDQLKLTEQAKTVFTNVLELPEFSLFALDFDYGTLTQDISTNLRKNKISTSPYVAK